jgi:streptogramin lyase
VNGLGKKGFQPGPISSQKSGEVAMQKQLKVFLCFAVAVVFFTSASASTNVTVSPGRISAPVGMVLGADGNMWSVETEGLNIDSISSAGSATQHAVSGTFINSSGSYTPQFLVGLTANSHKVTVNGTATADTNLYFTDQEAGIVGYFSSSASAGGAVTATVYQLAAGTYPQGITVGPDGNLWFVEQKQQGLPCSAAFPNSSCFAVGTIQIGQIPSTNSIGILNGTYTEYPMINTNSSGSTPINAGPFQPESYMFAQIVTGPDGNLWFTNPQVWYNDSMPDYNFLGSVYFFKNQPPSLHAYHVNDVPLSIAAGPDGNLWITTYNYIGKVNTQLTGTPGYVSYYPLQSSAAPGWLGITAGPNGSMWFCEWGGIGQVATSKTVPATTPGTITEYPQSAFSGVMGIASDGTSLWFAGETSNNFGKVSTTGSVTTYNMPASFSGSAPGFITTGSNDNMFFTEQVANAIGEITTGAVPAVSSYALPTAGAYPEGIVTGPDGNLYFTELDVNQLGKATAQGFTEASLGNPFRGVFGITVGPDSELWWTEYYTNQIGRSNISGSDFTEYSAPTANASPGLITTDRSGNLWFTEVVAGQIAKITLSGAITEYPIPTPNSNPFPIVQGPDGNMWFLENVGAGAIDNFNPTTNTFTRYPAPVQGYPYGLVVGSDGALWYGTYFPNGLVRVTTAGAISFVPLSINHACPINESVGPDDKLYVTDWCAGAISRLSAIGGTVSFTPSAQSGVSQPYQVATFVDGTPAALNTDFTATIAWGDGTANSTGTVTGVSPNFTVSGTHTFASSGSYTVTVTLYDNVDATPYTATATVAVQ